MKASSSTKNSLGKPIEKIVIFLVVRLLGGKGGGLRGGSNEYSVGGSLRQDTIKISGFCCGQNTKYEPLRSRGRGGGVPGPVAQLLKKPLIFCVCL